jgi:hypothetical protein
MLFGAFAPIAVAMPTMTSMAAQASDDVVAA